MTLTQLGQNRKVRIQAENVSRISLTALWQLVHCRHEILIASSTPNQQLVASHFQTKLVRTQLVLTWPYSFQWHYQTAVLHQLLELADELVNSPRVYSLLGCVCGQIPEPALSPVMLCHAVRAVCSCLCFIPLPCRCKCVVHAICHTGSTSGPVDCST